MRKSPAERSTKPYLVGKGRPPLATRWKSGQSGNPRGRPQHSKNLTTIVEEALRQKLKIQEKGTTRSITAREAIIKRVVHDALKGDLKAATYLLGYEPEISANAQPHLEPLPDTATPEERTARAAETYFRMIRGGRP